MLSQESIDWLTNNIHNDDTLGKKPKFIKMYGKSGPIWYKSIKNNQDGSEILVPVKPEEINFWKLK